MGKRSAPKITDESSPLLHAGLWCFGVWLFVGSKRELSPDGLVVALEAKPLNMLMLLLRYPGELITKADLMEALWTGRIVTDSVLSNCAAKLRTALGDDERLLRTVHGYGYRLEAHPTLESEATATPEVSSIFTAGASVPFRPNWEFTRQLGLTGETWLAANRVTATQRVFKFARTPRDLAALKREVTLYRLLRHHLEDRAPVVDLLDWNFDEPPWFLELHYCTLGSLAEYLDGQGGAKALTLEARIALIIQLAEGLSLVHNHGVLHKDLKPANVMAEALDHGGVRLLLADFGSGRLLDPQQLESLAITRLGFTQFGESSSSSSSTGTPLYYAPEVLSGQPVTLKSDIYALGVIAYQLIVGDLRRLFAPGWEQEITDELLREDIAACAAGDPAKRLADAQLLADRLRHLPLRRAERAAEAQKIAEQQALAQALREAKVRRRGLLLTSAALAAGLTASLALYWQAREARKVAEAASAQARSTRDFILKDVLGKLASGDEPMANMTIARLLEAAAQEASQRFEEQADLEASVRGQIGLAWVQLQKREAAAAEFEAALARAGGLQKSAPEDYVQIVTAHLVNEYNRNRFAAQLPALTRLHEQSKALLPANHPALFNQYLALAGGLETAGQFKAALKVVNEAVALATATADIPKRRMISLLTHQGRIQTINGQYTTAAATLERALTPARKEYPAQHTQIGNLLAQLGEAQARNHNFVAAEVALNEAAGIAKIWEPQPGELTLSTLSIRGLLLAERGNLKGLRKLLQEFDQILVTANPELARRSHYQRYLAARLALAEQRWKDSLQHAQTSRALAVDAQGNSMLGIDLLELQQIAAAAFLRLGNHAAAEQELKAVAAKLLAQLPAEHPLWQRQKQLEAQLRQ